MTSVLGHGVADFFKKISNYFIKKMQFLNWLDWKLISGFKRASVHVKTVTIQLKINIKNCLTWFIINGKIITYN